jgi:hypothetical protein
LQWQQTKQIKPHSKISQGTNSNLIIRGLNRTEFQEIVLFIILMDLKDHTGERNTIQGTTINNLKIQGGPGHLSLQ